MGSFFAMVVSVFLLPLWYLVVNNPSLLPKELQFIEPNKVGEISIFWQFMIAELGLDILRMAAVHTPSALATAMGLIAAIVIGQMAVDVGLFTKEVILYISIAGIGTFATPSYELSLANRVVRIGLLIIIYLFGTVGFIIGIVLWFLLLVFSKSLDTPYLWPLIPFNGKALLDVLVRSPMPYKNKRPKILSPDDPDRSPGT